MKKPIEEVRKKASKKEGNCNTGECKTCDHYIGYCRLGNDTERGMCCFHSGYQEPQRLAARKSLDEHYENNFGPMLEALKECESMIRTSWIEDSMTTICRAQEAIEAASTVEVSE